MTPTTRIRCPACERMTKVPEWPDDTLFHCEKCDHEIEACSTPLMETGYRAVKREPTWEDNCKAVLEFATKHPQPRAPIVDKDWYEGIMAVAEAIGAKVFKSTGGVKTDDAAYTAIEQDGEIHEFIDGKPVEKQSWRDQPPLL